MNDSDVCDPWCNIPEAIRFTPIPEPKLDYTLGISINYNYAIKLNIGYQTNFSVILHVSKEVALRCK